MRLEPLALPLKAALFPAEYRPLVDSNGRRAAPQGEASSFRKDHCSLALTEDAHYNSDYRQTSTKLNRNSNQPISTTTRWAIVARSDGAGGAIWTYSSILKHTVTQAGKSSFAYPYDVNGNVLGSLLSKATAHAALESG